MNLTALADIDKERNIIRKYRNLTEEFIIKLKVDLQCCDHIELHDTTEGLNKCWKHLKFKLIAATPGGLNPKIKIAYKNYNLGVLEAKTIFPKDHTLPRNTDLIYAVKEAEHAVPSSLTNGNIPKLELIDLQTLILHQHDNLEESIKHMEEFIMRRM